MSTLFVIDRDGMRRQARRSSGDGKTIHIERLIVLPTPPRCKLCDSELIDGDGVTMAGEETPSSRICSACFCQAMTGLAEEQFKSQGININAFPFVINGIKSDNG